MCGVSKDIKVMLVGRVIQGSGAGGILTLTEALITDLIPLRQRGNYFALIGVVWAFGSVSGMSLVDTISAISSRYADSRSHRSTRWRSACPRACVALDLLPQYSHRGHRIRWYNRLPQSHGETAYNG